MDLLEMYLRMRGVKAGLAHESKQEPVEKDMPASSNLQPKAVQQVEPRQTSLDRGNKLVNKPSVLSTGGFKLDIATYEDRLFLEEWLAADRTSVSTAAKLITVASRTVPVYLLERESAGKSPQESPTVLQGYGYVLYGTLERGGYAPPLFGD